VRSFVTGAGLGLVLGGGGLVAASLLTMPQGTGAAPVAEVVAEPAPALAEPAPQPAAPPMPEVRLIRPAPVQPSPDPAPPATLAEVTAPELPTPEVEAMPEVALLPEVAPMPEVAPAAPQVRVNRPGLAVEPEEEDVVTDSIAATPLTQYAARIDYAADLPKLAVVLVDDPALVTAPGRLRDLPFLPTIVIDPTSEGAELRIMAYRAAGAEVALRAALPDGAVAADVETTLSAIFAAHPETIALFSDGQGPEAGSTALAEQVIARLAEDGRGFIVVPRGLGGVVRVAEQGGLAFAVIDRTLEAEGASQPSVERGLQQAALRARQNGQAVMLGQVSEATIAAIRAWAGRSDPSQLALTPVSAVLLEQLGG
jgi:hypothetical protein